MTINMLVCLCLVGIFCRSVFMLTYPLRVAAGWLNSPAENFYRALGSFPSGNLATVTGKDLIPIVRCGGLAGLLVSAFITYDLLIGFR